MLMTYSTAMHKQVPNVWCPRSTVGGRAIGHRISRCRLRCLLATLVLVAAWTSARSELPAITQAAKIQPPGTLAVDFGFGYRSEPRDFGLPEHDARWDLGKTRLAAGLGKLVEVQATAILISAVDNPGGTEFGFGDWTLGTKIHLLSEQGKRPALALLWEVKIPVASNEDGIGTDETDFFAHVLLSKHLGERHRFDVNVGVGLLGDPTKNSAQDDVLMFSAAWSGQLSEKNVIGAELLARDGFRENDSPALMRGIYRRIVGRWSISAAVAAGLNDDADDLAVDLFVRRQFQLWAPGSAVTMSLQ